MLSDFSGNQPLVHSRVFVYKSMKRKKRPIKKYRKNGVENKKIRAMAFVDGFNLFHALKKCDLRDRWCNIRKLINDKIEDKSIILDKIWWFTAYYKKDYQAVKRHMMYAKALSSEKIQPYLGEYNEVSKVFDKNSHKIKSITPDDLMKNRKNIPDRIEYITEEEKKTDVNIAVKIVEGAFLDLYDIAYIVSGDSDLYTAVDIAKQHFKDKKFINVLPPFSKGKSMGNICHSQIPLGKMDVEKARFPDRVELLSGEIIEIPKKYLINDSISSNCEPISEMPCKPDK